MHLAVCACFPRNTGDVIWNSLYFDWHSCALFALHLQRNLFRTQESMCAWKRGKQFHLTFSFPEKPPSHTHAHSYPPHTFSPFSPASPSLILIVSICHTENVSTGSDAVTWFNAPLEHFLQKRYSSVQMLDLTVTSQNEVMLENVSATFIVIF